jgi:hypothetical protein
MEIKLRLFYLHFVKTFDLIMINSFKTIIIKSLNGDI